MIRLVAFAAFTLIVTTSAQATRVAPVHELVAFKYSRGLVA